jgi:biotin carboxyl carrier protein
MRYFVTIEGRTLEVDLTGEVPRVDGAPLEATLEAIPETMVRHLMVNGRAHALVPRRAGGHAWELHLDGERYDAEVVDERTRAIQAMTGAGAAPKGPKPVRAPMPGMVVRIAVGPGDRVEAGQSVAIIEAMKMENDLKAEAPGVVARVTVEAGQAVEKGAVLVEFGSEEGDG